MGTYLNKREPVQGCPQPDGREISLDAIVQPSDGLYWFSPPTQPVPEVRDGEPRTILDSWPFLLCGLIVVAALYAARAWGWL